MKPYLTKAAAALTAGLAAGAAGAQPTLTLSTSETHPTGGIVVGGTEFGDIEAVDIFFDTTDLQIGVTGATGAFSGVAIAVPAAALPGTHFITAIGRHSGLAVQKSFTVATFWQKNGFGSHNQNANPYENVLSPSTVSGLDLAWSVDLSSNPNNYLVGSPVVYFGRLYAADGLGTIHALSASSGGAIWNTTLGSNLTLTAPTVATSIVYVGAASTQSQNTGALYALSYASGKIIWSSPVGAVSTAPTVANGVVYFGTTNGQVVALNASTGALLYSVLVSPTNGEFNGSPAIVNGTLYLGCGDGFLYAINAASGAVVWSYNTTGPVLASPTVANGLVFAGNEKAGPDTDLDINAFNADSGDPAWAANNDAGGSVDGSAAAYDLIYTAYGDGFLSAYAPTTGAVAWNAQLDGPSALGMPAVANGVVYVSGNGNCQSTCSGFVNALNAQTGARLWSAFVPGNDDNFTTRQPIVVNGMVFIAQETSIYAYALGVGSSVSHVPRPSIAALRALQPH
jgi:outer membrane protein assembly factor BamB